MIQVSVSSNSLNTYVNALKFQRKLETCVDFLHAHQNFVMRNRQLAGAVDKRDFSDLEQFEKWSLDAWGDVDKRRKKLEIYSPSFRGASFDYYWGEISVKNEKGESRISIKFSDQYLALLNKLRDICIKETES